MVGPVRLITLTVAVGAGQAVGPHATASEGSRVVLDLFHSLTEYGK